MNYFPLQYSHYLYFEIQRVLKEIIFTGFSNHYTSNYYVLPFGDLPRDGEAVGDGSGLHPLLLPRLLPAPLVFNLTIVSKCRNLKDSKKIH